MTRRGFLGSVAGVLPAAQVTSPRATSGDPVEPDWQERMTVTVGPAEADIAGVSERAIQAAVDMVARWGGGTVRILPGIYKLHNAVYLQSNVRLTGSGPETVLFKEPSVSARLTADSDWYDQEITLADARGFQVGDGVCLRVKDPHHGGNTVLKRTLVARSGNRFKLDRPLRENFWVSGNPTAATLFLLVSGENIAGVTIENLTLDGNRANNDNLDGNHAGCIFLQDRNRIAIRKVVARHYNGDGISWQICHDVVVEDCHSHDHAGLGLHPGSGSQRPVMRRNRLERNDQGLFFCWGVKHGAAEQNVIAGNRRYGVSIGHRDTDNVVRNNQILNSGEVGVLFRKERGYPYQPHRNRVEGNRIINLARDTGIGIDIQGPTEGLVITGNTIRHTAEPGKRIGIRIGAEVKSVTLENNRIAGFSQEIADQRAPRQTGG